MNRCDAIKILVLCLAVTSRIPLVHATVDTVRGAVEFKNKTFDELELSGAADLKNVVAKKLTAHGSLHFDDLVIEEELSIFGSCSGKNLKAQRVLTHGGATLNEAAAECIEGSGGLSCTNVMVTGDFVHKGGLTAKGLSVAGTLFVSGGVDIIAGVLDAVCLKGNEHTLVDTNVRFITIEAGIPSLVQRLLRFFRTLFGSDISEQGADLYLSGATVVQEDVVFVGAPGVVHLSGSAVIKGRIVNGSVAS